MKENNFQVKYIEFNKVKKYSFLKKYQEIHHFELADHLLKERLEKSLKKSQELIVYDSPLFLLTLDDLADLATDELLDIVGKDNLPEERANEIIMSARAHWFEGEVKSDELTPETDVNMVETSNVTKEEKLS